MAFARLLYLYLVSSEDIRCATVRTVFMEMNKGPWRTHKVICPYGGFFLVIAPQICAVGAHGSHHHSASAGSQGA
ncbi:hypothetical protein V8C44DRAFT_334917 [Trichoderma aethiopicum]